MKIGLLQSSYLPWLGYFDQIAKCDTFVFYEDVQFEDRSWRNRNRIKTKTGWDWLTVPVYKTGRFGQKIVDVKINTTVHWQKKHIRSIQIHYQKAPYFDRYFKPLKKMLDRQWESLSDLNIQLITFFCEFLNITTKLTASTELKNINGQKAERILSICQAMNADSIIVGESAANYLDENLLREHYITIEYQVYKHPVYNQLYPPFIPYMSIIDLLFNEGDNSFKILYDSHGGTFVHPGDTT
jgi:hypothetical protein